MALEITFDQNEIEKSIRNHIGTLFTVAEGQNIAISLKAGRGENGFSATIEIGGNGGLVGGATPSTETGSTEKAGAVVSPAFRRGASPKAAATQEAPDSSAQADVGPTAADTNVPTSTDAGEQAEPAGEQEDAAPAGEVKAKPGLFAHLGNRTGTDKAE